MTQKSNIDQALLQAPMRFLWHYVQERSTLFLGMLLVVVLAATCAIAMQYQMKHMVDAMSSNSAMSVIWTALALFIGLMGAESALWRLCAWMSCRATIDVGVQMRLDLFDYLSGQSIRYFADNLSGSLGQRITGTAGNFGALSNTLMWRIVPPVVDFFGALLLFTLIAWPMAIMLGSFVTAATAVLIIAGRKGGPLHTRYFERASFSAGSIVDVITNMWAVKAFTARRREWQTLAGGFESEAAAQRASWMYTEKTRIVYDSALWLMSSLMAFWVLRAWSLHAVSAGAVVIVIALTFRILHGSREVALALVDLSQQLGYINETLRVIGQVHTVKDCKSAEHKPRVAGKVAFRQVTFGYDASHPVLRDINLEIEAGQKVGIVGASGAGKTTLIQLLQRLNEPQAGLVSIDDMPLSAFTQDSLREMLSVVPQDVGLFHRSVMDNIRFARPGASDAEVIEAARAARCDDFVQRLPQGYATMVGERGIKLSGGQRQRLGIARAFLKDAPILILDEATSALDTASELEIQRAISLLARNRTVLAVAHRLSTLAAYHRIIVVESGRVVEDGSPDSLRRYGTVFRSMWSLQNGQPLGSVASTG